MITSINEHDQSHWSLDSGVILFKVFFNLRDEVLHVFNLGIDLIISTSHHIVSKDKSLSVVDLSFLEVKALLSFFVEGLREPVSINVVNKSVSENSLVLVNPESNQLNWLNYELWMSRADSLENL